MKLKKPTTLIKTIITELLCGMITAGAPMLWGAYPFGIAYLMSLAAPSPFALAGAVIGCFFGERSALVGIIACTACCVMHFVYIKKIGNMTTATRLLTAAAVGVLSSFEAFGGDRDTKGILLFALCNIISAVAFCLVFIKLRNLKRQKRSVKNLLPAVAMFVASRFFVDILLFDIPLSLPVGVFVTLLYAHKKGGLYGLAYGFACGIACGAASLGALGIIGLTYAMFDDDSPFLAAALSFMLALPSYAYLGGDEHLTAAAIMLLMPMTAFLILRRYIAKHRQEEYIKMPGGLSLGRFAAAFSALSGVFYTSGDPALGSIAAEYGGIAGLLSSAATECDLSQVRSAELEKAVSAVLDEMQVVHGPVSIVGKREMTIEVDGVLPSSVPDSADDISQSLGSVLSVRLSEPEFIMNGRCAVMRLTSVPQLRIEYAKYQLSRGGEKVCGDTLLCFETPDKRFCCVLADGMGSGDSAAASSHIAAKMSEKLLSAGADIQSLISAINRALAERSDEVFSTLDMLICDRMTAMASVTKSGAAPCYLSRGGTCRVISASTPPLGILPRVQSAVTNVNLQKNDVLVMVSDGVYPTGGEDALPAVIEAAGVLTAEKMLSEVVEYLSSVKTCGDDMTVCVMRFY